MKKTLLLLAMPLMLSGCFEKDDDVQPAKLQAASGTEAKLAGTWIKTAIKIRNTQTGTVQVVNDENGDKINFSNGTALFTEVDGTQSSYNYQIIEANGKITIDFGSDTRDIVQLETNHLVFESEYGQNKTFIEEFGR